MSTVSEIAVARGHQYRDVKTTRKPRLTRFLPTRSTVPQQSIQSPNINSRAEQIEKSTNVYCRTLSSISVDSQEHHAPQNIEFLYFIVKIKIILL